MEGGLSLAGAPVTRLSDRMVVVAEKTVTPSSGPSRTA
jgi:hypothetical protein